ncbi:hypothetical protein F4778DRAFT_793154 [Xylariomycetidae sp. FL2044]|nr:hypothetical protein F4778DRAFT_793154 [Xylariomycetidae sp. FL2044]
MAGMMMSRRPQAIMSFKVLIIALATTATAKTCYRPDGSSVDDANNGGDACGSDSTYGLCGVTGSQLWRESCTDPTWESPACLKLCVDGDDAGDDSEITACSDGSYCCGANNAECCATGGGKFIVDNEVRDELPSQEAATTTTAATMTTTPTSAGTTRTESTEGVATTGFENSSKNAVSSTPSETLSPSNGPTSNTGTAGGLSVAETAGIAVGGTVGGLGLMFAVYFMWKRQADRRRLSSASSLPSGTLPSHPAMELPEKPWDMYGPSTRTSLTVRFDKHHGRSELDASMTRAELPSTNGVSTSEPQSQKYSW